jgi:hypothetical protein
VEDYCLWLKGILDTAQNTVVKAAKVGAEGAKDVATDALSAAASAAAGVVLGRVSEALGSGQKKVDEALPEPRQAVSATTTRLRQKPAKKRLRTKKGAGTQARAAKKRSRARRSTVQASKKNTSARKGGTKKKAPGMGRGRR